MIYKIEYRDGGKSSTKCILVVDIIPILAYSYSHSNDKDLWKQLAAS